MREVTRYVEDLVRRRRPRPFPVEEGDAEVLAVAIELSAGRPGADLPSEEFVRGLYARLAREHGAGRSAATAGDEPVVDGGTPGSRRRFLRRAAVVAASAASAAAGSATTAYLGGRSAVSQAASATVRPDNGTWRPILETSALPEGAVHAFEVAGLRGFLHRSGGAVLALSGVCTHQGCLLAQDVRPSRLDCPCHRTSFGLDGRVVEYQLAVKPRDLPRIPVRERAGVVEVLTPSDAATGPPQGT